jgi:SAM-dependent methyltransferase
VELIEFVLSQLSPPPARVLEVGCGTEGGITPALAAAGYDVLGIDPRAPEGPLFRRVTLEELEPDRYDAVVAARVLHHVADLDAALDKLAAAAPLLLLDEFAWERMDEPTIEWYDGQYRMLALAGSEPPGPPDLEEWRREHADLHPSDALRRAVDARYDERHFEWRPYLYRWLGGPATLALEQMLVDSDLIRALGFRYAGTSTDTTRSSAASR